MSGLHSQTRVIVAPDKFKGSARAVDVAAAIARGMRAARPNVDVVERPVADGGDGTVDAVLSAGFAPIVVRVPGPLGAPVDARLAIRGRTAVVELAEAVGLQRLPPDTLAPLDAGTEGLGRVIKLALDYGCRLLVLCLGGSASTDGGAGMLVGLGARVLDASGHPVRPGGRGLERAVRLDLSGLDSRLRETDILLAADVESPLLGEHGAATAFGPQKGATAADVRRLDNALRRWTDLVRTATGQDAAGWRGAGAAGGTGFAALAVLNARLRLGIDVVLEMLDFEQELRGATLVVTGEGRLDQQTLNGKAPIGVARAAQAQGIPVVAVAGECLLAPPLLSEAGFIRCLDLLSRVRDRSRAIADALPLLAQVGAQIAQDPGLLAGSSGNLHRKSMS